MLSEKAEERREFAAAGIAYDSRGWGVKAYLIFGTLLDAGGPGPALNLTNSE